MEGGLSSNSICIANGLILSPIFDKDTVIKITNYNSAGQGLSVWTTRKRHP